MADRPSVVVFDVNETLSNMAPLAERFADVGAAPQLAKTWFASLLRDGFALTAAGATETFARVGHQVLQTLLAGAQLNRGLDDAVQHIMAGFQSLPVHADVPDGIRRLSQGRFRLVTLTNGSTQVAERLLARAGIRDVFERLLSVEQAGIWKPARAAYEYAAQACDCRLPEMMLVAAHPWDIDGAARAGMVTAWINRSGAPYPDFFTPPQATADSVTRLADQLTA
jgi:2-haloacid dehalogenase